MANPKQVKRLKQGIQVWNTWRQNHPGLQPDLVSADLRNVDLSNTDQRLGELRSTLIENDAMDIANISDVLLFPPGVSTEVNLADAHLSAAHLGHANLGGANLGGADLSYADLHGADLRNTILSYADLSNADLHGADLSNADLSHAILYDTNLGGIDLRTTKGLTEIRHDGPSHIDLHAVLLPQDGSALHFLRGTGVPDEWIGDYRARMMHPIQYHSLFISYSSKDETLAHRLHADLQDHGVRCWFAPEDMKIGDKVRDRIDQAVQMQDRSLLLLSEYSIASTWVEHEVEAVLEKEDRQQREVLFPIRLDDAVMLTPKAWAATLRRSRHIGDFTNWADQWAYQSAFERLLRDLKQN